MIRKILLISGKEKEGGFWAVGAPPAVGSPIPDIGTPWVE
jgi:hypothetical protein